MRLSASLSIDSRELAQLRRLFGEERFASNIHDRLKRKAVHLRGMNTASPESSSVQISTALTINARPPISLRRDAALEAILEQAGANSFANPILISPQATRSRQGMQGRAVDRSVWTAQRLG